MNSSGRTSRKQVLAIVALAFVLRVFALGWYPIGLYSDEAAFGYNAYLLLLTGRDEYGTSWPLSLVSFGDWKPPMQAWLAIPFIKILGLNEFAVRLPSAILGTGTVAVIYFLAGSLLRPGLTAARPGLLGNAPLLAALLLAISPWHIFMSRVAMLVAVEAFFLSLGVLGLVKGLRQGWWWMIAAISLTGAVYSYYGARISVPLILVAFAIIFARQLLRRWQYAVAALLVGLFLVTPLLKAALLQPLVLTGRARTTSIFFNDNVRLQLWDAHTRAGLRHIPPLVSRFFDNKPYYYGRDVVSRYWSHLSPAFLFFSGDQHPPFKIPRLGYLHLIDLPFFLLGLWELRKRLVLPAVRRVPLLLLFYLLITPLVASFTFLTPAANRSLNLVIPWTLVTAVGLSRAIAWEGWKRLKPEALLVGLYLLSLGLYAYSYVKLIPNELPRQWHYGRRELVAKIGPMLSEEKMIFLTNKGGPPYIFLSFYLPIPPDRFRQTIVRNPVIDELGWTHVDGILNIAIPREFDWESVAKVPGAVYIGFENEIPAGSEVDVLDQINYPDGTSAYTIVRYSP